MTTVAPEPALPEAAVPARALQAGERVAVTVTGLVPYGAFAVSREGHRGLIHISEISDWYVEDVRDYFRVGEVVTVEVVGREERTGKYSFSTRRAGGKQPLRAPRRRAEPPRRHATPTGRPGPGEEQLIAQFLARRVGELGEGERQQLQAMVARHGAVRVALTLAGTRRRFATAAALLHWAARQLEPRRPAGAPPR